MVMIEVKIALNTNSPDTVGERLWGSYADSDYRRSNSWEPGFKGYLMKIVPGVEVRGDTLSGFVLKFKDESDFIMFKLRWL
jgi:hypothetical protein